MIRIITSRRFRELKQCLFDREERIADLEKELERSNKLHCRHIRELDELREHIGDHSEAQKAFWDEMYDAWHTVGGRWPGERT